MSVPLKKDASLSLELVGDLEKQGLKLGEFLSSDQGLSIDFAHHTCGCLAFVAEDREWVAWTGTHWARECAASLVKEAWDDLIRAMLVSAQESGPGMTRDVLVERVKLASRARAQRDAISLAEPKLMASREAFDRGAEDLLNTPTGIVDLRTGALAPCDPERRLTQCTAIGYDAAAPDPERFLELVRYLAGEDNATADWLLRALGYTITGRVSEDLAFFLRGPGGNGKSTLLKAVASVLGSYAHPLDIKFLTAGGDQGHSTDFAALRLKRLVVTSEVNKGQRLSTSRMKDLTGGDLSAYREIRQRASDAQRWAPSLKLWLYGNHDLVVPGNDEGTWRRIVKIASDHKFAKSGIRDAMAETEGPGILRMLVDAAGRWYREGLTPLPERIIDATNAYRREQDTLGRFFGDCLEFVPDATIGKQALTNAYEHWRAEEGAEHAVGPREMRERLTERGVAEGWQNRTMRVWKGVRLKGSNASAPAAPLAGRFTGVRAAR